MSRFAAGLVRVLSLAKGRMPGISRLVPLRVRRGVYHGLMARAVADSADRVYLESVVIPAVLAQRPRRVLSVGVEAYTSHHPAIFERAGIELWTIDIDPYHARWGAPGRHRTADVRELERHFSPSWFDIVIFNGVIGFGINDELSADRALQSIAGVLRAGGWLIIGWNTDKGVDALALAGRRSQFRPFTEAPVPPHAEIAGTTHVFDHLVRTAQSSSGLASAATGIVRHGSPGTASAS